MILIGDIGGTKTALAVISRESGPRRFLAEGVFSNAEFPSLEVITREFLKRLDLTIDGAVLGVAGPVINDRAKLTNVPWILDRNIFQNTFNFSHVHLMNDLELIAHAVPTLERSELFTLNEGTSSMKGNMAVVAPGTGLGEAFITWDGKCCRVHPSEGGHTDFAPKNRLEADLLNYLRGKFDHVSYERVCSGPGISNIYAYLRQEDHRSGPPDLAEQSGEEKDLTPAIINAALDEKKPCDICARTLNEFVSILGSKAGNLALTVLATNGVYLSGGIIPRMLPLFKKDLFMKSFCDKGRHSDFMKNIPVHIILNTKVALTGAACKALELNSERIPRCLRRD